MTYKERTDHISALLESQLGVRGKTLEVRLRKAGRLLPKHMQRHGETLVSAQAGQASPKLARMIDDRAVHTAFNALEGFLKEINVWDRRKNLSLSILSSGAFSLLVVFLLLVTVLRWRGFV